VATVLAAIGVYVTVAYMARTRAREFAIRAALGERRGQLFVRAFASAAVSGGSGVALGLAAAVLFGRFLSGFLYGTAATDAVATAASGALVLLVVTATAYTGARWLLAFEPVDFLHYE
jgi:ABC-type antimicrobial peptide transport system permease subunit